MLDELAFIIKKKKHQGWWEEEEKGVLKLKWKVPDKNFMDPSQLQGVPHH